MLLTPAERLGKIAKIKNLPAVLEAAVKGLNDDQLNTPYGEGKWTIRQVVHHLADSHMNAFVRVKLALTEQKPTLKPYDQEEWAKLYDTTELPIQASLLILNGLHERWSALLEALPDSSWNRPMIHPEIGDLTLDDLLVTYAHHGENHVGQITKLRAEKGW